MYLLDLRLYFNLLGAKSVVKYEGVCPVIDLYTKVNQCLRLIVLNEGQPTISYNTQ